MRVSTLLFAALSFLPLTAPCQAADRLGEVLGDGPGLQRIAGGYQFAEGPVWDAASGTLIFSDVIGNAVWRLAPDGKATLLDKPARNANGHSWAKDGALLVAEHGSRSLVAIGVEGRRRTLAARFGGKRLNSPNDVVVRSDGMLLFTDPPFGLTPPYGPKGKQELAFAGVYALPPGAKEPRLLTKALKLPNGIALSPDERTLYLTDSATNQLLKADLAADGTLSAPTVLASLADPEHPKAVVDGMKLDAQGRLFVAAPGGVAVLLPDGTKLGLIPLDEPVTDVAWGDDDFHGLWVTTANSVYHIRMRDPGIGSGVRPVKR